MLGRVTAANVMPAFHEAVKSGDTECVKIILEHFPEFDLNAAQGGRTALEVAYNYGKSAVAKMLLGMHLHLIDSN